MDLLNKAAPSDDEVSKLKGQLDDMKAKNASLVEQLKNALEGKVDDVKEFMANLSIQEDATAKIQELASENEKLQGIVSGLQEKVQALIPMAGGVEAVGPLKGGSAEGVLGDASDQANKAAEAQEKAEEAAAAAAAEAEKAAAEAQEQAEEAAAAAASAAARLTAGFW